MDSDDLHAQMDELALAGLRRDSVLSSSDGEGSVSVRRTRSLGRSAHPFALPPHTHRSSRHPYSSPFALLSAPSPLPTRQLPHLSLPPPSPISPTHTRSRSALPVLPSPTEDGAFFFAGQQQRERERDSVVESLVGTFDTDLTTRTRSDATFPSPSASTLAIPLYPTAPRPSSQPEHGSPFGDDAEEEGEQEIEVEYDSDPSTYSYHPNSAVVFGRSGSLRASGTRAGVHRSLSTSTASTSASAFALRHRAMHSHSSSTASSAYPYRPSMSSESAPLLPPPPPRIPASRSGPARPQTTNNLLPEQKLALRKTTRKLERVLGEVPQLDRESASAGVRGRGLALAKGIGRGRISEEGGERLRMRVEEGGKLVVSGLPAPPPLPLPTSAPTRAPSPSTTSISGLSFAPSMETDDPDHSARRRRRQTLQKIHRYLGVVVPAEAVSGAVGGSGSGAAVGLGLPEEGKKQGQGWKAMFSRSPSGPGGGVGVGVGLGKDDMFYLFGVPAGPSDFSLGPRGGRRPGTGTLGSRGTGTGMGRAPVGGSMGAEERARNVKRAAKMEQVFGAAPPPALYVSRPAATTSAPHQSHHSHHPHPHARVAQRDVPRRRARSQESPRRSTHAEVELLPREEGNAEEEEGRGSYTSWRLSLASLDYLVESGNRDSLASLLAYLTEDEDSPPRAPASSLPSPIPSPAPAPAPPRASSPSQSSTYTSSPAFDTDSEFASPPLPPPNPPAWKRAAKLRKFFGVSYRELFDQLLERIESGAREDRERGCLTGEEYESVLRDLRALRGRRESLSEGDVGRAL